MHCPSAEGQVLRGGLLTLHGRESETAFEVFSMIKPGERLRYSQDFAAAFCALSKHIQLSADKAHSSKPLLLSCCGSKLSDSL